MKLNKAPVTVIIMYVAVIKADASGGYKTCCRWLSVIGALTVALDIFTIASYKPLTFLQVTLSSSVQSTMSPFKGGHSKWNIANDLLTTVGR